MVEKKILVIDDEELVRNVLSKGFTLAGYSVRCAVSGEDALEILKEDNYGVIFLDLNLPGMNGVELCEKVRREYPMTIVFAVTGYGSLFELNECREAGFDDYFTKPVGISVLLEAAERAFERLERWQNK